MIDEENVFSVWKKLPIVRILCTHYIICYEQEPEK